MPLGDMSHRKPLIPAFPMLAAAAVVCAVCLGSASRRATRLTERVKSAQALNRQTPADSNEGGFVGSSACQSCHPAQYGSWHDSFHRTMTQRATPEAVLGDFDDVTLEYFGREYRLSRRGEEFWIAQSGGRAARVVQTTGSHHYQVYWVNGGRGNMLQNFPYVYLLDDKRWVRRNDVFMAPAEISSQPESVRPWNDGCIACHSTHGVPRVDERSRFAQTTIAELGISCEACHGPAQAHLRRYGDPTARYARRLAGGSEHDDLIVNPATLDAKKSAQVCGQCHSISRELDRDAWLDRGFAFRPGDELVDSRDVARHPVNERQTWNALATIAKLNQYFWNDGMVRVSGREYNGLLESACHQQGELSCLSCHSMHHSDPNDQLAAGMDGDRACLSCHDQIAGDVTAHTRHGPVSSGSRCYNCHMPHTTYGLLKAIRTHEIESPNLTVALQTGRPHACNLCHLDKTLAWTAEHLSSWYGESTPRLSPDEQSTSAALLYLLQGDAGQRAIVAWHAGWAPAIEASGSDWLAPHLAELLRDPYSVVRYIAGRSLRRLPGFADFAYDYVADDAALDAAVARARKAWPGAQGSEAVFSELLLDEAGEFDAIRSGELLKRRNNRPVDLLE